MAAVMTRLGRVDVETHAGRCANGEVVDGIADDEVLPVAEDACTTRKRKCVLDVPHLRQSYTCIWTVDLAHLLNNFGLEVYFFTITLGANPEFFSENFYKDNMEEDRGRVETLFHLAPEQGIRVQRRSTAG
eukprot:jgi/Pico_ML_1/51531/g213.t1